MRNVRINGEPLGDCDDAPVPAATSDIKRTPPQWDKYDPRPWLNAARLREFEAIEAKQQRTLSIVDVKALFAPMAARYSPVEVAIFGALALIYWGHDVELKRSYDRQSEAPFATYVDALRYLLTSPEQSLGLGSMRFEVAEDKDEDLAARRTAQRNGIEHIKAKGSHVRVAGCRGEHALTLRHDLLRAIAAACDPFTAFSLMRRDVGEWVAQGPGYVLSAPVKLRVVAADMGCDESAARETLRKARGSLQDVLLSRGLIRQQRTRGGPMTSRRRRIGV